MTTAPEIPMRRPITRTTLIWRSCPRCGALTPNVEHSISHRIIDPLCCGIRDFFQPKIAYFTTATRNQPDESHASEL